MSVTAIGRSDTDASGFGSSACVCGCGGASCGGSSARVASSSGLLGAEWYGRSRFVPTATATASCAGVRTGIRTGIRTGAINGLKASMGMINDNTS